MKHRAVLSHFVIRLGLRQSSRIGILIPMSFQTKNIFAEQETRKKTREKRMNKVFAEERLSVR
jgi:hypothetical protein